MSNVRQLVQSSIAAGCWPATSGVDICRPSYNRAKLSNTRKNCIRSKAAVVKAILAKNRVPVEDKVHDQQPVSNTHAVLQANVAMVDFAKKLPLEELRTIGYQPTTPTPVKRGNTAMSEDSRTLSLDPSSDSTWSSACGYAAPDDDGAVFGSLLGCGIGGNRDEVDHDSPREPNTNGTWNTRRVLEDERDAGIHAAGHSGRTLSLSQQSDDSCDLFLQSIGLPIHETSSFPIMSIEEFEALPDWSDVEEEDEYNVFVERYHHWSNTNSALSSWASTEADFVFPTMSVPPGFSAADMTDT